MPKGRVKTAAAADVGVTLVAAVLAVGVTLELVREPAVAGVTPVLVRELAVAGVTLVLVRELAVGATLAEVLTEGVTPAVGVIAETEAGVLHTLGVESAYLPDLSRVCPRMPSHASPAVAPHPSLVPILADNPVKSELRLSEFALR